MNYENRLLFSLLWGNRVPRNMLFLCFQSLDSLVNELIVTPEVFGSSEHHHCTVTLRGICPCYSLSLESSLFDPHVMGYLLLTHYHSSHESSLLYSHHLYLQSISDAPLLGSYRTLCISLIYHISHCTQWIPCLSMRMVSVFRIA